MPFAAGRQKTDRAGSTVSRDRKRQSIEPADRGDRQPSRELLICEGLCPKSRGCLSTKELPAGRNPHSPAGRLQLGSRVKKSRFELEIVVLNNIFYQR